MKARKAKRRRGRPKTHGLSRTRAYRSWHWITYTSKHRHFSRAYYGYRISLCKEWQGKKGMIQFYEDMGERPAYAELQVIDVTQPFSKTNCSWEKRSEELTKEQSNALIHMMQYISDHRNCLDRWESSFFKRINNYLKSGCPTISIHCFVKIKDIFEKLSTIDRSKDRSDPCTITDDYAGGALMYSRTPWKDVETFLKMKELESNDANSLDRGTGTSKSYISDKTSSISGQGDIPPATKKGGVAPQAATPWEYDKFLAAMPRLIDLSSVDRQSYIDEKFLSIYGQGPTPPFATEYDKRYFQLMKEDAEFRRRWREFQEKLGIETTRKTTTK
jgi:hypothetical protein